MARFQKFMFDNFVIACGDRKATVEPTTETGDTVVEHTEDKVMDAVVEEIAQPEVFQAKTVSYSEAELAAEVRKAEEKGYERGFNLASDEASQRQEALLADINAKLSTLLANNEKEKAKQESENIQMAVALVRTLLPSLEEQQAKAEVEKFLSENFQNFRREDYLSFCFHPETTKIAAEIISKLAEKNDFEGRISIHKDDSLNLGDCRVEWKNGGVEKNSRKMLEKAEKLLDDNTTINEERK